MHRMQEIVCMHAAMDPNGKYSSMLTVLKPKFASSSNYPLPNYSLVHLSAPRSTILKLYDSKRLKICKILSLGQVPSWWLCLNGSIYCQYSWSIANMPWMRRWSQLFSWWNNLQLCRNWCYLGWKSSMIWCGQNYYGQNLLWRVALGFSLNRNQAHSQDAFHADYIGKHQSQSF